MTIDRLGSVDPVSGINKSEKAGKSSRVPASDSVSVSDEARKQATLQQISHEVKNSPDIRMNRIEEVKQRLEDPNYINESILGSVADDILDLFGIQ